MKPRSADTRRPNDEPYYIDKICPDCGTKLVYNDLLEGKDPDSDPEFWYDEFACPNGCQGKHCIYMDWPDDYMASTLPRK